MLVPPFMETLFRFGLTLVMVLTTKIELKNVNTHKKINKQKRIFKKLGRQMDKRETNTDHGMKR